MNQPTTFMSARIGELQYRLVFGDHSALAEFWDNVTAEGTPLVEPIADDAGHVLVTFLWRASLPCTAVGLDGEVFGRDVAPAQMTQLLDTDVWYKTYRFPADLRATYMLVPHTDPIDVAAIDADDDDAMVVYMSTRQSDPLNQQLFVPPHGAAISSFSLPAVPQQPYLTEQSAIPKGIVHEYPFRSSVFNNERTIAVYTPPDYRPDGKPYPLLVLFDGGAYLRDGPVPTVLDNLLAEQRVPPVVAVGMYNAYPPQREYELACNPLMVEMLQHELSGGFGWTPNQLARDQTNEPEWLARQVIRRPLLPVRFFLAVGRFETTVYDTYMPTQLTNSRHMRNVLQAKGYDVQYIEYPGAHDFIWWQSMLAEGLLALLGSGGRG